MSAKCEKGPRVVASVCGETASGNRAVLFAIHLWTTNEIPERAEYQIPYRAVSMPVGY
jgi:hypothetical protein